jgi:hypothetical protein
VTGLSVDLADFIEKPNRPSDQQSNGANATVYLRASFGRLSVHCPLHMISSGGDELHKKECEAQSCHSIRLHKTHVDQRLCDASSQNTYRKEIYSGAADAGNAKCSTIAPNTGGFSMQFA